MHLPMTNLSATHALVTALLFHLAVAAPLTQRPLGGSSRSHKNPYDPDYRDKYDHKIDAVGDDLDPLPYRNGKGASVLGPYNEERARQMPDMIRPPSTDSGNMKSMHCKSRLSGLKV